MEIDVPRLYGPVWSLEAVSRVIGEAGKNVRGGERQGTGKREQGRGKNEVLRLGTPKRCFAEEVAAGGAVRVRLAYLVRKRLEGSSEKICPSRIWTTRWA